MEQLWVLSRCSENANRFREQITLSGVVAVVARFVGVQDCGAILTPWMIPSFTGNHLWQCVVLTAGQAWIASWIVNTYMYCIVSNSRPGVDFFHEVIDLALIRYIHQYLSLTYTKTPSDYNETRWGDDYSRQYSTLNEDVICSSAGFM